MIITGTRKGIGRHLAEHYAAAGYQVVGCSRGPLDDRLDNYRHFSLDVCDERAVTRMFSEIRKTYGRLDVLVNNAGVSALNHSILTPVKTVQRILDTNVVGTFLFSREAAKLMMKNKWGRIINFVSFAIPFKVEGDAIYAASKAAVASLTEVMAREYAELGISVNAVSPPAIQTDAVRKIPRETLEGLLERQAIHRFGTPEEVRNVIDFFIQPESEMVTGQIVYLGGI